MRLLQPLLLLALSTGSLHAQAVSTPPAVTTDPAIDATHPATYAEITVPSHGEQLFGIWYAAAGAGRHPTIVLLHGFPGYEQNLDLAQSARRAGWNVLAVHYRGSWGVGGTFSLAHAMEDADAMVAFVRSPEIAAKRGIDPSRVVVIGHSMGGYMAASASAHDPAVLGTVMIGTWDITAPVRSMASVPRTQAIGALESHGNTEPADFLPLHGYSPAVLASEIVDHREAWDLDLFAPKLASRPVLLLTANDGSEAGSRRLEQALHEAGDTRVQRVYTPTDHAFSDRRIYLQSLVLNWLSRLPGAPALP